MARTGRPKVDDPLDRRVTIRFTKDEYEMLVEFAADHDMNVTQAIKNCIQEKVFNTQKEA